jgi:hypothetical protein
VWVSLCRWSRGWGGLGMGIGRMDGVGVSCVIVRCGGIGGGVSLRWHTRIRFI